MADHRTDLPIRDFVICGAGPVGAACALFLRERGIAADRIALIDARTREAAAKDDRMIAISHGSATLLARIGAWRGGALAHATPITSIHISHRGRFGRTVIDRGDYRVPALGYVIRHGDLTHALDAALMRQDVEVMRPMRVTAIGHNDDALHVATTRGDGSVDAIRTHHVVHAEGGLFGELPNSQQRRAIQRDYRQTAITAFVTLADKTSSSLAHTAFERFTEAGPIALLPARDAGANRAADTGADARIDTRVNARIDTRIDARIDGYALVWCGRPEEGEERLAMNDADFLDALHAAFGDRLGRFGTAGPRRAFPLGLHAVEQTARAHSTASAEFAIGNAAQALHPVAGQGLNLGLRDAYVLAHLLADADAGPETNAARDATALVARFTASRRVDRAAIVDLTDFMPRIFANPLAPVAWGRGLTLALLDVARPLRGVFARQMMNGRR